MGIFFKAENKFYISGILRDSNYYQEENLYFNLYLSDFSKSDTLKHFYSQWDFIVGWDAISDYYLIDTTSDNFIQISSINTVRKEIYGTFQIKLIRDSFRYDKGEIFQYKDGQFNLHYTEVE